MSDTVSDRNKDFDFNALKWASISIADKLRQDENSSVDLFNQFQKQNVTSSQRYFVDPYRTWGNTIEGRGMGAMLEYSEFIPIPQVIKDEFAKVECAFFMGLIPEINRAWITVDCKLYLWDYTDSSGSRPDIFEGLSEVIVSVALSAPKPGIFQESVKYVLAVATPIEIALLAISFDKNFRDVKMRRTDFTMPADNVTMYKIVGSQAGRIFMSGNDGNLYEFDYSMDDGLLSMLVGSDGRAHKCRKINHFKFNFKLSNILPPFVRSAFGIDEGTLKDSVVDDVRHILYAVTTTGSLYGFYLGSDDNQTIFFLNSFNVFEKTKYFLTYNHYLPESSPNSDLFKDSQSPGFSITGLFPIPLLESKKSHLLVVLGNGIRIYLSLLDSNGRLITNVSTTREYYPQPGGIAVQYVRSPPSISCINSGSSEQMIDNSDGNGSIPLFNPSQPLRVSNYGCFYGHGVLLLTHEISQRPDEVIALFEDLVSRTTSPSSEIQSQPPSLREGVSVIVDRIRNGGKVQDIKESCTAVLSDDAARISTLYFMSKTPPSLPDGMIDCDTWVRKQREISGQSLEPITMLSSECPVVHSVSLARAAQLNDTCLGYGKGGLESSTILSELSHQSIPSGKTSLQRKFAILTDQGVHVVKKLRPIDILYRNLMRPSQNSEEFIRHFIQCFSPLEYCAMSISIAVGVPTDAGQEVYSFDPNIMSNFMQNFEVAQTRAMSSMLANTEGPKYKQIDGQGQNTFTQFDYSRNLQATHITNSLLSLNGTTHKFLKSPAHDALYLTASRILRPIWLRIIVKNGRLSPILTTALIDQIRTPLLQLSKVLTSYFPVAIMSSLSKLVKSMDPKLYQEARVGHISDHDFVTKQLNYQAQQNEQHQEKVLHQQARKLEDASLSMLYRLISRAIHALNLIEIGKAIESNSGASSTKLNWNHFSDFTFYTLVISTKAHHASKKFVDDMINLLTVDQEKTRQGKDTIDNLTQNCYHYFSKADRLRHEADNILESCKKLVIDSGAELTPALKERCIHAVDLSCTLAKYWNDLDAVRDSLNGEYSELSKKCSSLMELANDIGFMGVVDICFETAININPSVSSDYTKSNKSFPLSYGSVVLSSNGVGTTAVGAAKLWDSNIYHGGSVMDENDKSIAIDWIYKCLVKQIIYLGQGRYTKAQSKQSTNDIMLAMIERAGSKFGDQQFHDLLHSELKQKHQSVLLRIRNEYVEDFLHRENPDLLYVYYEQHGEYIKASQLMSIMAKDEGRVQLGTRIEYFCKSIASAESGSSSFVDNNRNVAQDYDKNNSSTQMSKQLIVNALNDLNYLRDTAMLQQRAFEQLNEDFKYSAVGVTNNTYNDNQKQELQVLKMKIDELQYSLLGISDLFNICLNWKLWDTCLKIYQLAKKSNDDNDYQLICKLWLSLIYRVVPETGRTDRGKDFLKQSRNVNSVFMYERYQQNKGVYFEEAGKWLPALEDQVVGLGKELTGGKFPTALSAMATGGAFPILHIVEELEEIFATLRCCKVSFPSCNPTKYFYDIGLSYGTVMEAYLSIYDNWKGKEVEKVLHLLNDLSNVMMEWTKQAQEGNSQASRDLFAAVRSGHVRNWIARLRQEISTLGSRQLLKDSKSLLERISQEFYEVDCRITTFCFAESVR